MQSKQTRGVRYNPVVKMHSCSSSNPSVQRCFTYQNVATKMKNVLHKTLLFTLYSIFVDDVDTVVVRVTL